MGKQIEHGGIAKDGAKMVSAVANAAVPKFTVIVGGSYGAGNYGMCGRAFGPRQLWMWPNARISVMGGEQAAHVLLQVKMDRLQAQGKSMTAAGTERIHATDHREVHAGEQRVLQHGPALGRRHHRSGGHTKSVLGMGIAAAMNAPQKETRFGVFRM